MTVDTGKPVLKRAFRKSKKTIADNEDVTINVTNTFATLQQKQTHRNKHKSLKIFSLLELEIRIALYTLQKIKLGKFML